MCRIALALIFKSGYFIPLSIFHFHLPLVLQIKQAEVGTSAKQGLGSTRIMLR
jgi:hypothetical protein